MKPHAGARRRTGISANLEFKPSQQAYYYLRGSWNEYEDTAYELWFTDHSPAENVDAPAVWRAPDGASWLFATAKSSHSILLNDSLNGRSVRRIGGRGAFPGQFDRPNGISVVGDYLYIVERDNRRVHLFEVEINGTVIEGEHVKSFGDTAGAGILHVVESIYGDPVHGHLLIVDEDEEIPGARNIKVYDFAGDFTGRTVGGGFFVAQPQGITLWTTGSETGYWIFTDQGKTANRFLLFDRVDFTFKGAFSGRYLLNTDGIWLEPVPTQRYPEGLFYAVDNDASVAAFCLREMRRKLGLQGVTGAVSLNQGAAGKARIASSSRRAAAASSTTPCTTMRPSPL